MDVQGARLLATLMHIGCLCLIVVTMTLAERAALARKAYERAVEAARKEPTRARWARLLRAAKNLREALDSFDGRCRATA